MIENENTDHSSFSSFYSSEVKNKIKNEIIIEDKNTSKLLKVISEI